MSGRVSIGGERIDVLTLGLLLAQWTLIVGSLALWWTRPGPFLLHFAASALAVHLAFTIWHEAGHRTVFKSRALNDVVGVLGMFPYMTPFFMQKWIHLEHHKHLNEGGDPNLVYLDGPFLTLPFRYLRAIRYGGQVLANDPRSKGERLSDNLGLVALAGVYAAALWFGGIGAVIDLLLLWFAPLVVAKLVMDWYVNYLPHIGLPADRFLGTRIIDVEWVTPLILWHNYHAIHHLWPSIPWHQYKAVFTDRLEYLRKHRVPIEHAVFAPRKPLPLPAAVDTPDAVTG